jgi:hypothetical protein
MKITLNVDTDIAEKFERLGPWRVILALDPGSGSTGWALLIDGRLWSGQGKPEDVVDTVRDILDEHRIRSVDVLVVEDPFSIGKGNQWKLAWCAGFLFGTFRLSVRRGGVSWRPKPASWRAALKLNVSDELNKEGKQRKDREAIERAVWLWCKARTNLALTTTDGKIEADRCMAIGMLYAARRLALSLKDNDQ